MGERTWAEGDVRTEAVDGGVAIVRHDPTLPEVRAHFANYMAQLAEYVSSIGRPIPCKAGCFGCCRGEVGVFEEERADVLAALPTAAYERLKAQGLDVDPTKAVCPALDPATGRCSIYNNRPLMCRAYVVVSEPDICYPERVKDGEPSIIWEPIQKLADMAGRPPEHDLRALMVGR